jgi:hypothetical protein
MYIQLIDWPAKNPDLSPSDQVWIYVKHRLRGRKFDTGNTLFAALEAEWNMIPDFVIENFVSSFHAGCVVCYRIEAESLSGHWNEV